MNNQQVTKIVNFLQLNYDFHSPYTYLVDGNFLKLLMQKQLDFQYKLKTIVSGKHQVKVTNQMLGNDFKLIYERAQQFRVIACDHTFKSVDRCVYEHCSEDNLNGLIVCSQDRNLRRNLRHFQVGLMYFGPDQRITMEDIQRKQFSIVKNQQKQKLLPAPIQQQAIQNFKDEQRVRQKIKNRKEQYRMASQKGVELKYIKKKLLKGPNPLATKKKKQKSNSDANKIGDSHQIENNLIPKQKRIRKRKNKCVQGENNM